MHASPQTEPDLSAVMHDHPDRAIVLAEAHARPHHPISAGMRLIHLAFTTDAAQAEADRERFARFCAGKGLASPGEGERYHRVTFEGVGLRWEQHSEFATYTFSIPSDDIQGTESASGLPRAVIDFPFSGLRVVAVDLRVGAGKQDAEALFAGFDSSSLSVSLLEQGGAMAATDFRADAAGFVPIYFEPGSLTPLQIGFRVQQLLEIETYRTFALLGLPLARRLWGEVDRIEAELVDVTKAMSDPDQGQGLAGDQRLLDRLSRLASTLEAGAASANFRFSASKAYEGIVQARLQALGGVRHERFPSLERFLLQRLTPAMRTCEALRERQADLSRKLARAANLLRTRVDIALESQNRDLLASMNERTRLQLRLQQTVEGLSVAAISYYVVGLFGYLFKAGKEIGFWPFDPAISTGVCVVPTVIGMALLARAIRRHHDEAQERKPRGL